MSSRTLLLPAAVLAVYAGLLLTACPQTGLVCNSPLRACGNTCVAVANDEANCGACGRPCGAAQVCQAGQCVCQLGATACGSACVVTADDPNNCGGCAGDGGAVCDAYQVCQQGVCQTSCTLSGVNDCSGSCVDLSSDPNHCGSCTTSCPPKESCHNGQCRYDVMVACISYGSVAGLEAVDGGLPFVSAPYSMGPQPTSLATDRGVLLSLDDVDNVIYEADLRSLNLYSETPPVEKLANHMVVNDPYVYVVNSGTNNLEVLQRNGAAVGVNRPDGGISQSGTLDGGLGLVPIAELSLGSNTNPAAVALLGTDLYITLWAGQSVVRVSVANPAAPVITASYDLTKLNLRSFSGGSSPFPWGITAARGYVYAALNNLSSTSYAPNGDGMLAKINPADGGVTAVDLGADVCLNAYWLTTSADQSQLFVSCSGAVTFGAGPNYNAQSVDRGSVLLLGSSNQRLSTWTPTCPAGVDAGCSTFSPGRMALRGNALYVADNSYGRVAVLQVDHGHLSEQVGFADGGDALAVCPPNALWNSNVADVISIP